MATVYITKSNSERIIKKIDLKNISNLEGEVYKKPICWLSTLEKNKLLLLKALLKDPENFIEHYYVSVNSTDKLKYVYEGEKPAYHLKPDCEWLNSDYRNFEIPEEIREKGKEEILKFRSWFKQNQYLLEKPDVFVARLQTAFGLTTVPKAIHYRNAGIETKENLNLEELEKRIDKYLDDVEQYFNESTQEKKEIIRLFKKRTFLAYSNKSIYNNYTRFSDETIKKFLEQYDILFKIPTQELLIEYYRVLLNPDLKFEDVLLENLGFKPCEACRNEVAIQNAIKSAFG